MCTNGHAIRESRIKLMHSDLSIERVIGPLQRQSGISISDESAMCAFNIERKKIASVIAAPDWGGIHAVIERTTPHLAKVGFERVVICPTISDQVSARLEIAGAKIVSYSPQRPRRTLNPLVHLAYLRGFRGDVRNYISLFSRESPDIVEVVGLLNLQPVLAAMRANIPVVWQLHSTLAPIGVRVILGLLSGLCAKVLMTSGAGMISRHGGLWPYKSRIVPFCAPLSVAEFRRNESWRLAARHAWGYAPTDIVVGTLGNRGWQKHHEMLVRVARALKGTDTRLKFAIVGSSLPGNKDRYGKSVEKLVTRLGLHTGGYVNIIDQDRPAPEILNGFDIFALTSVAEGASLVTAEAMATGLPIVSTDVGSLGDNVIPSVNGYLVKIDDVNAMARAIVALLDHKRRKDMGHRSREIVEQRISTEKCTAAHIVAYGMALESGKYESKI